MKQVTQEDHFEKSSGTRGLSPHAAPEGFNGRKPWGLDAKGADVGDDPWAFDHGIRRSPAEGRDFEGAAVRRSPAEELVSKGYFLPYAKRRCEGEELRCGAYRYRLREDGTARLVSYEGSAEQVDIPALCRDIAADLRDKAEKSQVSLTVEGQDVQAEGVRRLLHETIYNLCDNAIGYNVPGGSVRVTVSDAGENAVISVADTGIGIAPEHQSRIFERFYRVDKSHSKASGGTGLGLSIVKHAVAYHHGTVQLESQPGKGTTITVTIPRKQS